MRRVRLSVVMKLGCNVSGGADAGAPGSTDVISFIGTEFGNVTEDSFFVSVLIVDDGGEGAVKEGEVSSAETSKERTNNETRVHSLTKPAYCMFTLDEDPPEPRVPSPTPGPVPFPAPIALDPDPTP